MILGTLSLVLADLTHSVTSRHLDAAHRRLLRVEADPRIATADDIELLVRAHGVPEQQVWTIVDRLDAADLDATDVWNWTMANDGSALAELCATPLSDDQLTRRLTGEVGVVYLTRARVA